MAKKNNEKGIALIITLLVMMLMTALLVGFTAVVSSDQRYRYIDRDRNRAFYGASAGIEKMTNDLGTLFLANVAPTEDQLTTMADDSPSISLIQFSAPTAPGSLPTSSLTKCGQGPAPANQNTIRTKGTNGYALSYCSQPNGQPTFTSQPSAIVSGPYEGLIAQQMPYQLDVTAATPSGGEVHLVRAMEAVAIPVFQFGIFSDVDQSFFAGPTFDFGGRVHTNGNLFLSQGNGNTLWLRQKVTAVGEILRDTMQNNALISLAPAHQGTVQMAQAPNVFRPLGENEGSMNVNTWPSANPNDQNAGWHGTSIGTYNSYIRNGRTGARALNLALIMFQGANIDLVRRALPAEDVNFAARYSERMYTKASLRILLSDTAADITGLPGVSPGAPVSLETVAQAVNKGWRSNPPVGYGTLGAGVDTTHPPLARSAGVIAPATITGATAAGNNQTINIGGGVPANFRNLNLTVNQTAPSVLTYTLTNCNTKTLTTFVCTSTVPAHTVNLTAGTISVTGGVTTADDPAPVTISAPIASWPNGSTTVTVSTNTMRFAPDTFWTYTPGAPTGGRNLVSCTGYTSTTLTGCNMSAAVANNDRITTSAQLMDAGLSPIGGFIKIDRGNTDGTWTDVTMEILNYGIAGPNLVGFGCGDPTPNAILRLQRVRDNNSTAYCPYAPVAGQPWQSTDFWPNVLFDTREALLRDTVPANNDLLLGGVMHYISVDAANLSRWFLHSVAPYNAGTGNQSKMDNGGFTLYFSDRRNNRQADGTESGEYGFEDFVNPAVGNGAPNGAMDAGEDVNGSGGLPETYGQVPSYGGAVNTSFPGGAGTILANNNANTQSPMPRGVAQTNRAVLFRRALKLVNGANLQPLGITGLTIVAENPVYVQGNWNAPGNFNNPDVATSVIADSVTLLSNEWNDVTATITNPYAIGGSWTGRTRTTNPWYRLAIISGKGRSFTRPAGTSSDFGTDGGAHNFLRFLESGGTVNYQGSMATFFYNRQGVGTYKCCNTVYQAPGRNFSFDTNFLTPSLLPPNTPMFRDLNAVGFAQEMRPGK